MASSGVENKDGPHRIRGLFYLLVYASLSIFIDQFWYFILIYFLENPIEIPVWSPIVKIAVDNEK